MTMGQQLAVALARPASPWTTPGPETVSNTAGLPVRYPRHEAAYPADCSFLKPKNLMPLHWAELASCVTGMPTTPIMCFTPRRERHLATTSKPLASSAGPRASPSDPPPPPAPPLLACSCTKARTIRLCTFPVGVLGITSKKWILMGILNEASLGLQCSMTEASVTLSAMPCLATTAACTTSPYFSSGIPNATASASAWWEIMAASISRGEIFSPPRLMSSLSLPVSVR
mmetsp:Transcript_1167/g.4429  ORF Transcript_1167/g.4429 Transcript_1167/m.4429 type:complete len:229 (-) Transcript_1167:1392-2078(-)